MKPTSNTNVTIQRDIDAPFDLFRFEAVMSFGDLQNLRIILKAASQMPVFTKDERQVAMRLITQADELLDSQYGIDAA